MCVCVVSLSMMKLEARRRRKQRETHKSLLRLERKRRVRALVNQYAEWSHGLLTGGLLDLALVRLTGGYQEGYKHTDKTHAAV